MIGVLCPSDFEYRALDQKKIQRTAGVVLHRSGMGKVRVLYACSELMWRYPDLKAIALIGFAGALTPDLEIGDVIEPRIFIEQDYCAEPLEKFPNVLRRRGGRRLRGSSDAVMLTQDKFLRENPYRGTPLADRYKRIACDMESYAVAYFCEKRKMRFAVSKLISDRADASADHDFLKACHRLSPKLNRVTHQLVGSLT